MSILSKMEKGQIEFLFKDGNDCIIAKQFGVTRQFAYKIRKKFQIPSSRSKIYSKRKQIVNLRREGASVSSISVIVGMSQSYIYKILRSEIHGARVNSSNKNTQ